MLFNPGCCCGGQQFCLPSGCINIYNPYTGGSVGGYNLTVGTDAIGQHFFFQVPSGGPIIGVGGGNVSITNTGTTGGLICDFYRPAGSGDPYKIPIAGLSAINQPIPATSFGSFQCPPGTKSNIDGFLLIGITGNPPIPSSLRATTGDPSCFVAGASQCESDVCTNQPSIINMPFCNTTTQVTFDPIISKSWTSWLSKTQCATGSTSCISINGTSGKNSWACCENPFNNFAYVSGQYVAQYDFNYLITQTNQYVISSVSGYDVRGMSTCQIQALNKCGPNFVNISAAPTQAGYFSPVFVCNSCPQCSAASNLDQCPQPTSLTFTIGNDPENGTAAGAAVGVTLDPTTGHYRGIGPGNGIAFNTNYMVQTVGPGGGTWVAGTSPVTAVRSFIDVYFTNSSSAGNAVMIANIQYCYDDQDPVRCLRCCDNRGNVQSAGACPCNSPGFCDPLTLPCYPGGLSTFYYKSGAYTNSCGGTGSGPTDGCTGAIDVVFTGASGFVMGVLTQ